MDGPFVLALQSPLCSSDDELESRGPIPDEFGQFSKPRIGLMPLKIVKV